jgi:acyl carrier protein
MTTQALSDLTDRATRVIAIQLCMEPGDVKPESNLEADLHMDSLDAVELVMALEDEFAVELPDAECEQVATVADLFALLAKHGATA